MELPASGVVGVSNRIVVIPSPPPFFADDEIEERVQCPRCHQITSIAEPGMTTCTRCNRLLFLSDESQLVWPTHGSGVPECPNCELPGEGFAKVVADQLVCSQCGFEIAGGPSDCSGFQIISPEDVSGELLESWFGGVP
jgi:ribosomal protein L37AE/L43A